VRNDVGLTDLAPGEVHIKVVSSGVCHSDVSAQNGTIPAGTPCVLGHEGAGVVLEVGPGVTDLKAGDHAIVSFVPACRMCKNCLRGQSNLCETMIAMAITPHFVIDGKKVSGMTGCGTFAEEMILPQAAVIKVDQDIPLNVVSLIGCGVTTGVGAAINTAKITPGSSVVVFGVAAWASRRSRARGSLEPPRSWPSIHCRASSRWRSASAPRTASRPTISRARSSR
jgi:S-(hydroxymethyl)glutathione dehydrogenase/alcohol dehydrogenase